MLSSVNVLFFTLHVLVTSKVLDLSYFQSYPTLDDKNSLERVHMFFHRLDFKPNKDQLLCLIAIYCRMKIIFKF